MIRSGSIASRAVERDAELALGLQRLQSVHVVGHGRARTRLCAPVVVPACPGPASAGQHPGVGVQHRLVHLIGDRGEDRSLERLASSSSPAPGRSGWPGRPRRSARPPLPRPHPDPVLLAAHRPHRRAQPDPLRKRRHQRLDVPRRPAANDPPAGPTSEPEHAVVVEELGQEAGREAPHLPRIGRPDGRRLGHDQALYERLREPVALQPVAERRDLARGQQLTRSPVEAREVGHHAMEPRRDEVRALREQAVRRGSPSTRSRRARRSR